MNREPGFTLVELLTALLILSVIATFTIPKVLHVQQDAKRKAIFKEAFSVIADINHQGWMTGAMTSANNADYFVSRINAVKICTTNASTEGCAPPSADNNWMITQYGVILHNGAMIDFNANGPTWNGDCANMYLIDWNGASPPNLMQEDQMELEYNCNRTGNDIHTGNRPGVLRYNSYSTNWSIYKQMYEDMFE